MRIKTIRVFDLAGKFDRYTVCIPRGKFWDIYGMSDDPFNPQGFNQFSHTSDSPAQPEPEGGEVEVEFKNLPQDVQKAIRLRAKGEK
jgi:hypothetical protein